MSNQIVISSGAKVRALEGVLTGTAGIVNALSINVPNGIPQLDGSGKILVSQLPNSVMEYKGTWNAATNTPTLVNGTGNQGDVYLCNVAGTVDFGAGPIVFFVGDQVIYSGTIWQRASGASGTVTSVAVTETGDALTITGSPITTSGTINIGFAGNSGQYVNGAGGLTTFPSLTGYVPYTGATTNVDLGTYSLLANSINALGSGTLGGTIALKQNGQVIATTGYAYIGSESAGKLNIYFGDTGLQAAILDNSLLTADRTFTLPDASGTLALTSDIPSLTGYVPYTGATANVNLGTFDLTADVITGATGSFASNGGSNTFAINHSSGSGIALNITKGGSGEGLYINKTSGSGNAATIIGTLNATTLVKSGGTSSQYLMADGSTSTLTNPVTGTGLNGAIPKFTTTGSTIGSSIIFDSGTQIGINTLSPSFTLDVNGTARVNGVLTLSSTISNGTHTYTLPSATGTLALTSQLTNGTVTSVGLSSATSGVTIGSTPITTSGTITLAIATASGSQNGLLSSTDWTTFNNKQSALTNPVTGTGTTNYLPKFTGASTIGNSAIYDNGGNIGIGTITAGDLLTVVGSGLYPRITIQSTNTGNSAAGLNFADNSGTQWAIAYDKAGTGLQFFRESVGNRMYLTNSGNLGLGVTPSAWGFGKAIEVGYLGTAIWSPSADNLQISNNAYYDSGWKYAASAAATSFGQVAGQFRWNVAPSGTAGNAISFTQAMTLASTGNLLVGTTTDAGFKLDVNGTGRFSGMITSSTGNSTKLFTTSGATTGYLYADILNTGGRLVMGVESSVGGTLGSGYDAYAAVIASNTTANLNFGTNGIKRLTLNGSTGAATFSSSVTATGALSTYGLVYKNPSATTIGALYTTGGGAGQFYLYDASGTEKVLINTIGNTIFNGGNVIIGGTTAGTSLNTSLTVNTASAGDYAGLIAMTANTQRGYYGGTSTGLEIGVAGSGYFSTWTSGTERMRITSGGNVLIGRTTSNNPAGTSLLEVGGSQAYSGIVRIINSLNQGDVNHGSLMIVNTANYAVGNDASIGFALNRSDNSFTDPRASIGCKTESDFGGALVFNTRSNSGTFTEKMRITSGGNVLIGTTTDAGYKLNVNGQGRFLTTSTTPLILQTTGGNCGIQILTSATTHNWLVAAQYSAANTFEITPSTTVGGGTYSSPVFKITNGGAATFSSSVTTGGITGIAVSPSPNTLSNGSIDLLNGAGMFGYSNKNYITANMYYSSSWLYKATAAASLLNLTDGGMILYGAASGTAGTGITLTQLLSIAQSGAATFSSSVRVNGTPAATSGILSVVTNTSTLGATADLGLLISNGGSLGQMSQIGFGYSESRSAAVIGGVISNGAGATTSDLFFATRSTTTGSDAPTERLRITNGGNVGIGTSSPQSKLHVYGGDILLSYNNNTIYSEFAQNASGGAINLKNAAGVSNSILRAYDNTQLNTNVGNVLIGTTTDAGQKLQVNGITKTNGISLAKTSFSSSTTMTDAFFSWSFGGAIGQTLTLYNSSGHTNMHFIKNESSIPLTIAAHSGGVIMGLTSNSGSTSITLLAFKTVQIISFGGSAWYIMYQTT